MLLFLVFVPKLRKKQFAVKLLRKNESREIKFNVKLLVYGKGQLVTVTTLARELHTSIEADKDSACACLLPLTMQPHVKNKLRSQTLLPFPLEHGRNGGEAQSEGADGAG